MIVVGSDYAVATSEAQQATLVAAAAYPAAMLRSPMIGIYSIVIPSLGALFVGIVMLQGVFSRPTADLALAMGVVGILSIGSFLIERLEALRCLTGLLAVPLTCSRAFGCTGRADHDDPAVRRSVGRQPTAARASVTGGACEPTSCRRSLDRSGAAFRPRPGPRSPPPPRGRPATGRRSPGAGTGSRRATHPHRPSGSARG